jgi:hypothetical protein
MDTATGAAATGMAIMDVDIMDTAITDADIMEVAITDVDFMVADIMVDTMARVTVLIMVVPFIVVTIVPVITAARLIFRGLITALLIYPDIGAITIMERGLGEVPTTGNSKCARMIKPATWDIPCWPVFYYTPNLNTKYRISNTEYRMMN